MLFRKIKTFLNHIYVSFKIGRGLYSKCLIVFIFFVIKTPFINYFLATYKFKIYIKFIKYRIIIRVQDYYILYEIFGKDIYKGIQEIKLENNEMILDIGGHIGLASLYFNRYFPSNKIISVEPSTKNFSILYENVSKYKNIEVLNVAVGEKNSFGKLFISPLAQSGNSLIDNKNKHVFFEEHEIKSLDFLMSNYNIKIIKFDVEGAELDIFSHSKMFKNVDYIIGEIKMTNNLIFKSFISLFDGFNIDIESFPNQMKIIKMKK